MLVLIVVRGPAKGQVIQVSDDDDRWIIGRQRQSGRKMVWLHDTRVSRHHADLICREGMWYIRDAGSSNGTYVNEQLLRPGEGLRALHDGDQIAMGRTVMVAGYVEGAAAQALKGTSGAAPSASPTPLTTAGTSDQQHDDNDASAADRGDAANGEVESAMSALPVSDAASVDDDAFAAHENDASIVGVAVMPWEDVSGDAEKEEAAGAVTGEGEHEDDMRPEDGDPRALDEEMAPVLSDDVPVVDFIGQLEQELDERDEAEAHEAAAAERRRLLGDVEDVVAGVIATVDGPEESIAVEANSDEAADMPEVTVGEDVDRADDDTIETARDDTRADEDEDVAASIALTPGLELLQEDVATATPPVTPPRAPFRVEVLDGGVEASAEPVEAPDEAVAVSVAAGEQPDIETRAEADDSTLGADAIDAGASAVMASAPSWRSMLEEQSAQRRLPRTGTLWKAAAVVVLAAGVCVAFYQVDSDRGSATSQKTAPEGTFAARLNDEPMTLSAESNDDDAATLAQRPSLRNTTRSLRDDDAALERPSVTVPPRVDSPSQVETVKPAVLPAPVDDSADIPSIAADNVTPANPAQEVERLDVDVAAPSAMVAEVGAADDAPAAEMSQVDRADALRAASIDDEAIAIDREASEPSASGPPAAVVPPAPPIAPPNVADIAEPSAANDDSASDAAAVEAQAEDAPPAREPASIQDAGRIVFIVDASGSQVDTLPMMLKHLDRTVAMLDPNQQFTVVFFQGDRVIEVPPAGLKTAQPSVKRRVEAWIAPGVGRILPMGVSDPTPALRLAASYQPDQVFLYSNRIAGTRATDADVQRLLDLLDELNADRTIQFNAVQFFYDDPRDMLRRIAAEHHGTHTFIVPERPDEDDLPPSPLDVP